MPHHKENISYQITRSHTKPTSMPAHNLYYAGTSHTDYIQRILWTTSRINCQLIQLWQRVSNRNQAMIRQVSINLYSSEDSNQKHYITFNVQSLWTLIIICMRGIIHGASIPKDKLHESIATKLRTQPRMSKYTINATCIISHTVRL